MEPATTLASATPAELRRAVAAAYRTDETAAVARILATAALPAEISARISRGRRAKGWMARRAIRPSRRISGEPAPLMVRWPSGKGS